MSNPDIPEYVTFYQYSPQDRLKAELEHYGLSQREWYYKKYLQSYHWDVLRKEKFAEVGRICEECKATDVELHVHHLDYKNIFDVELSDLQVLCKTCHHKVHGIFTPKPKEERKLEPPSKDAFIGAVAITKEFLDAISVNGRSGWNGEQMRLLGFEPHGCGGWKKKVLNRYICAEKARALLDLRRDVCFSKSFPGMTLVRQRVLKFIEMAEAELLESEPK